VLTDLAELLQDYKHSVSMTAVLVPLLSVVTSNGETWGVKHFRKAYLL
jgi:hypothetical protein